jgi:hypothetical protein
MHYQPPTDTPVKQASPFTRQADRNTFFPLPTAAEENESALRAVGKTIALFRFLKAQKAQH